MNKLQWYNNCNSESFIQEYAFQMVICKMAAILSRPQCVNTSRPQQNGSSFVDNIFKLIFLMKNILNSTFSEVCALGLITLALGQTPSHCLKWFWHIAIYYMATPVFQITASPTARSRQLWRRTRNFLKFFFNFMFIIWGSRPQDWQLFWLSFEHWQHQAIMNKILLKHGLKVDRTLFVSLVVFGEKYLTDLRSIWW